MHFLFPSHPLNPRLLDETFGDQIAVLAEAGFSTSLVPDSLFAEGKPIRDIPAAAQGRHIRAVGWLDKDHPFPKGPVPPDYLAALR